LEGQAASGHLCLLEDTAAPTVQEDAVSFPLARVDGVPGREVGVFDDAAAEPAPGVAGLPGVHRLPDEIRVGEDHVALPGIEPHAAPAADALAAPRCAARAEAGGEKARGDAKLAPVDRASRLQGLFWHSWFLGLARHPTVSVRRARRRAPRSRASAPSVVKASSA